MNLIGEHTDYNNGFVFPMALPLATVIIGESKFQFQASNTCSGQNNQKIFNSLVPGLLKN